MINQELIKTLWKKIDDIVDWSKITGKAVLGQVLEMTDNILGPMGLAYLNENYIDRLPDSLELILEAAISAFVADDWQGVIEAIPEGIDNLIDIKQFPDDFEAQWIAINTNGIIQFIHYYAEQKALAE